MPLMLSKTYDALKSAHGISDDQARAAAEEIASYEHRLTEMQGTLKLHTVILSMNTAMLIAILARVFFS
jgi:hypothetical protein